MEHSTPLTKESLVEALQGLAERLDASWDLKLDSKLQRFATRDDLQRFATKDDLQRFATRDDFAGFRNEFLTITDGLQASITGLETKTDGLQTSIAGLQAKTDGLQTSIAGLQTKTDGLQTRTRGIAATVARLEGNMHDVRGFLKTQVATKQDLERVMRFADRGLKEMDEHRQLRSTRGALLTDVAEKVEDHERRLRDIEGRA